MGTVAAMAAKDTYEVVRTGTVDASPDQVYAAIADFTRWRAWSPWEDVDPNLERTYSGADAGVGAVYEWKGNRKAGEGRMEITEAIPATRVEIALHFLKPFRSENVTTFTLEPDGEGTLVRWAMVGPKTLFVKVMGVFSSMDKMIGPDFEKGLAQLQAELAG